MFHTINNSCVDHVQIGQACARDCNAYDLYHDTWVHPAYYNLSQLQPHDLTRSVQDYWRRWRQDASYEMEHISMFVFVKEAMGLLLFHRRWGFLRQRWLYCLTWGWLIRLHARWFLPVVGCVALRVFRGGVSLPRTLGLSPLDRRGFTCLRRC